MLCAGLLSVGSLVVVMSGCGSSDASPNKNQLQKTACVPNQVLRCICELDEGVQVCGADGTLGPCDCNSGNFPIDSGGTSSSSGNHPHDSGASSSGSSQDGGADAPSDPRCGDGRVDPGEACDDGNTKDGDGCSSFCIPDGHPISAQTCPGQPVTIWPEHVMPQLLLTGSTDGFSDMFTSSCVDSKGADRVYAITPKKDGNLSISMKFGDGFTAVVSLHDACAPKLAATSKLFCSDTIGLDTDQLVQVVGDKTYYLVVDGDQSTVKGPYEITLTLR
jgi:cysteine-rich repeat protein